MSYSSCYLLTEEQYNKLERVKLSLDSLTDLTLNSRKGMMLRAEAVGELISLLTEEVSIALKDVPFGSGIPQT
ncbi:MULTISPECIES: hypothetical protein [Pseudomonas]|uniref:Uncharacterized protein n=1 Tax=Pseudomonas lutea TaxID=243924 RepID=A0A9X8QM23_9PSED|nr:MULTISPECIES: hypothetical protein [Pseudomonas]SER48981.1 hypothetical protein SAMN05216409_1286 [Pseudomonas lutea]